MPDESKNSDGVNSHWKFSVSGNECCRLSVTNRKMRTAGESSGGCGGRVSISAWTSARLWSTARPFRATGSISTVEAPRFWIESTGFVESSRSIIQARSSSAAAPRGRASAAIATAHATRGGRRRALTESLSGGTHRTVARRGRRWPEDGANARLGVPLALRLELPDHGRLAGGALVHAHELEMGHLVVGLGAHSARQRRPHRRQAAVHDERLSRHERRVVAREEERRTRDVLPGARLGPGLE